MATRWINFLIIIIVVMAIYGLFAIKEMASIVGYQLAEVTKQLEEERNKIHLLKAEFAYLTSPARLRKIANTYLKLESIKPQQLIRDPINSENTVEKVVAEIDRLPFSINEKRSVKWRYKKAPAKYVHTVSSKVR